MPTIQEEVVKLLRSEGELSEYEISTNLMQSKTAYIEVRGDKKGIPPRMIRNICVDSPKFGFTDGKFYLRRKYK